MQLPKYCSSKEIISRCFRDSGMQQEIPFSDAIEWIADGLNEIGAPLQYRNKIAGYLEFPDWNYTAWKIKLPCDFHRLRFVTVNNIPALPSTNAFHYLKSGECCGFSDLDLGSQDQFLGAFGVLYSPQIPPISGLGNSQAEPPTFDMNDNFMTFSWKSGRVCMAYWAFPVDEEGFPEIPDTIYYKKYLTAYLMSKLDWIAYRAGMITRDIYENTEIQRMWSAGQVSANAKIPDELQQEVLKNELIKLVPRFQEFWTKFQHMNSNTDRN